MKGGKNMVKGIDVSSHQGNINWEETKKSIDFAIIRCGYGNNRVTQDDNKFERNADYCEQLGIPYGVYLYSYATNLEEAASEVEHTLRLIQNRKLEYPVFLDVESEVQRALPNETLVNVVEYYCTKMEEAGYYVGIYANLDWFVNRLDSPKLDKFDHWLAQWSEKPTYQKPFGMWQYTSKLTIPGIDGYVDGDIAYKDYPKIIRENNLNHLDKPVTNPLKFQVGDQVLFTGTLYKDSYGAGPGQSKKNLKATITQVNPKPNATKPYNLNNGLGWVSENDLTKIDNNELTVGTPVQIILPGKASKDGSGKIAWGIGYKRTVLSVDPNATFPYRIGDQTGTTGFYKRNALKKL